MKPVLVKDLRKIKKMLLDNELVGLVDHGSATQKPPKHGWKMYPARVLTVNDDLETIKAEMEWLEGVDPEDHLGITPRRRKVGKDEVVDDDEPRKAKEKRKNVELDSVLQEYEEERRKDKATIQKLREQVDSQQNEIRRLQNLILNLQDGVSSLIKDTIEKSTQQFAPRHSVKMTDLQASPSFPAASADNKAEVQETMTVKNLNARLAVKKALTYKKMTRTLMTAMFPLETLLKSSVTGKKLQNGEPRPALDPAKVKSIIDEVKKRFVHANDTDIKACMAQKLKDLRQCGRSDGSALYLCQYEIERFTQLED
ncbi:hypothetical protein ANANG_G00177490 [Anguilla anguilla]|uniref:BEN domain-containing protein n=2 Tax=Anguilla anguilla TaxID=7936 RepID=A0A9D3M6C5_ANGAN|nr:hypothetical protein ANANG_G00177490 [Anguilla anguilla]